MPYEVTMIIRTPHKVKKIIRKPCEFKRGIRMPYEITRIIRIAFEITRTIIMCSMKLKGLLECRKDFFKRCMYVNHISVNSVHAMFQIKFRARLKILQLEKLFAKD